VGQDKACTSCTDWAPPSQNFPFPSFPVYPFVTAVGFLFKFHKQLEESAVLPSFSLNYPPQSSCGLFLLHWRGSHGLPPFPFYGRFNQLCSEPRISLGQLTFFAFLISRQLPRPSPLLPPTKPTPLPFQVTRWKSSLLFFLFFFFFFLAKLHRRPSLKVFPPAPCAFFGMAAVPPSLSSFPLGAAVW